MLHEFPRQHKPNQLQHPRGWSYRSSAKAAVVLSQRPRPNVYELPDASREALGWTAQPFPAQHRPKYRSYLYSVVTKVAVFFGTVHCTYLAAMEGSHTCQGKSVQNLKNTYLELPSLVPFLGFVAEIFRVQPTSNYVGKSEKSKFSPQVSSRL